MNSVLRFARREVRDVRPCVHGGEVWDVMSRTGLRRNEILDFSANVNPLGPSPLALESIRNNLDCIPYYPDSDCNLLREVIAKYLGCVSRENVILGNGSTEIIHLFAEVFIEKGDSALIPVPTFGEYEKAVRKMGGKPRYIRLSRDFHIDLESFLHEMEGAKIIFLCNPNNPTSTLIPHDSLLKIVEKAYVEGALVFLDESFIEFVDEKERFSMVSEIENYPNLFVLRSFTKVFGLAGLRVGYGVAHSEVANLLLRAKIPWNVNCLAQAAAIAALNDDEYLRRTWRLIRDEKAFLLRELRRIRGFKVFPAHANFILINIRDSGFTAAELKERLLKYGILIRDCSSFRGLDEYYIRVAVRTRPENEKFIKALRDILNS
ncbi:threonine-phosphate decarboxylase [Candidatus Bathyarchaeota archaeon]|nr:threonine-phosphate decarboxylase [Candidatus Bathyarchaeota archaeon]